MRRCQSLVVSVLLSCVAVLVISASDGSSILSFMRHLTGCELRSVRGLGTSRVRSSLQRYEHCLLTDLCVSVNVDCVAGAGAGASCVCHLLQDVNDIKLQALPGFTHMRPDDHEQK